MAEARSYLSVFAWPAGFDEAQKADALASVLSVDRYRAKELSRRRVPAILARCSVTDGAKAERQLKEWGTDAMAVPSTSLERHFGPAPLRALTRIEPGHWRAEFWRDEPIAFNPHDVILLVRAHARGMKSSHDGDFGVQALHQLHGTLQAQDWDQGHSRRARIQLHEVLDIHLIDGRQWRLLGDKFAFDCLGPEKKDTIRDNIDLLGGKLAADTRSAAVNRDFEEARFLAEFVTDFFSGEDWRSMAGFTLYSAWLAFAAARTTAV